MFNWFDKLLVKVAKKILNRYAPKGEFIAYINKQEEKKVRRRYLTRFLFFFSFLETKRLAQSQNEWRYERVVFD